MATFWIVGKESHAAKTESRRFYTDKNSLDVVPKRSRTRLSSPPERRRRPECPAWSWFCFWIRYQRRSEAPPAESGPKPRLTFLSRLFRHPELLLAICSSDAPRDSRAPDPLVIGVQRHPLMCREAPPLFNFCFQSSLSASGRLRAEGSRNALQGQQAPEEPGEAPRVKNRKGGGPSHPPSRPGGPGSGRQRDTAAAMFCW